MNDDTSYLSFDPVNVLKHIIVHIYIYKTCKNQCFVWGLKENIVLGAMQVHKKMQTL